MQLEWNLHYFRWVIGDGEPELHVGDVFDWFAISFWSNTALTRTVERTKAAVPIADNSYRVNAEVIYVSHDPKQAACILDFGFKAISAGGALDILPPECQGEYVTGEVKLELPLCTTLHPHNLAHRWRVNRISADLTPYVPHPVKRELIFAMLLQFVIKTLSAPIPFTLNAMSCTVPNSTRDSRYFAKENSVAHCVGCRCQPITLNTALRSSVLAVLPAIRNIRVPVVVRHC